MAYFIKYEKVKNVLSLEYFLTLRTNDCYTIYFNFGIKSFKVLNEIKTIAKVINEQNMI